MPALDNKNFDQEYNSSKAVKELFRVQVPMLTKNPRMFLVQVYELVFK